MKKINYARTNVVINQLKHDLKCKNKNIKAWSRFELTLIFFFIYMIGLTKLFQTANLDLYANQLSNFICDTNLTLNVHPI